MMNQDIDLNASVVAEESPANMMGSLPYGNADGNLFVDYCHDVLGDYDSCDHVSSEVPDTRTPSGERTSLVAGSNFVISRSDEVSSGIYECA